MVSGQRISLGLVSLYTMSNEFNLLNRDEQLHGEEGDREALQDRTKNEMLLPTC